MANTAVVYDRRLDNKTLVFEASGSLFHNALVMQDDQTSSFWAIIQSKSIGGPMKGKSLTELPITEKTTWAKWRKKHPDTSVLSINGKTHLPKNAYDHYFKSDRLFGDSLKAPDRRLPQKAPIFAFSLSNKAFAISFTSVNKGGWMGVPGNRSVFIYRDHRDSIYQSTRAYFLEAESKQVVLRKVGKDWIAEDLGKFNPETGGFNKSHIKLKRLTGIDTFWYIWSQHYQQGTLLSP